MSAKALVKLSLSFSISLVLSACASGPDAVDVELMQICESPRPQMCTMEYAPVCAFREEGNSERRQYSNGCGACADPEVSGYVPGPCPDSAQ